jgi:hypothetical protein
MHTDHRLVYQPPASSTFISQQTSHQQPASSTLLSEQTSTSHQPPANRTGYMLLVHYYSLNWKQTDYLTARPGGGLHAVAGGEPSKRGSKLQLLLGEERT